MTNLGFSVHRNFATSCAQDFQMTKVTAQPTKRKERERSDPPAKVAKFHKIILNHVHHKIIKSDAKFENFDVKFRCASVSGSWSGNVGGSRGARLESGLTY